MSDKHLDVAGQPLCGGPAEGVFLVDEPVDVTCPACLFRCGELRRKALSNAKPLGSREPGTDLTMKS